MFDLHAKRNSYFYIYEENIFVYLIKFLYFHRYCSRFKSDVSPNVMVYSVCTDVVTSNNGKIELEFELKGALYNF